MTRRRSLATLVLLSAATLLLAACGRSGSSADTTTGDGGSSLSGRITADGSSTVGPFTTFAAEGFQRKNPDVQVTVGISGTGGGFERFCRGETDLSDASRPIEPDEAATCKKNDIEYTELLVANDGIAIVVNPQNDWINCITTEQLKRIWEPGSKVDNWRDLDPSFPDVELKLAGAGTDSGTFDFFTEKIVGEEGASRSDYQASENDNVIVEAVAGDNGALGYFGLSYFELNKDRLKDLEVNGGSGCVSPSTQTVQNETYKPLSRPLFIYAKHSALEQPEVAAFVRYVLDNQAAIAEGAQFVPLTQTQEEKAKSELEAAIG